MKTKYISNQFSLVYKSLKSLLSISLTVFITLTINPLQAHEIHYQYDSGKKNYYFIIDLEQKSISEAGTFHIHEGKKNYIRESICDFTEESGTIYRGIPIAISPTSQNEKIKIVFKNNKFYTGMEWKGEKELYVELEGYENDLGNVTYVGFKGVQNSSPNLIEIPLMMLHFSNMLEYPESCQHKKIYDTQVDGVTVDGNHCRVDTPSGPVVYHC